ncbi:hypothetical protein C8J57DRAFT_1589003 [Mycena rebaudengoi]|nr:hypothetical protein C8J57DRAFT_1589003 [Mycena rebaudengoi]
MAGEDRQRTLDVPPRPPPLCPPAPGHTSSSSTVPQAQAPTHLPLRPLTSAFVVSATRLARARSARERATGSKSRQHPSFPAGEQACRLLRPSHKHTTTPSLPPPPSPQKRRLGVARGAGARVAREREYDRHGERERDLHEYDQHGKRKHDQHGEREQQENRSAIGTGSASTSSTRADSAWGSGSRISAESTSTSSRRAGARERDQFKEGREHDQLKEERAYEQLGCSSSSSFAVQAPARNRVRRRTSRRRRYPPCRRTVIIPVDSHRPRKLSRFHRVDAAARHRVTVNPLLWTCEWTRSSGTGRRLVDSDTKCRGMRSRRSPCTMGLKRSDWRWQLFPRVFVLRGDVGRGGRMGGVAWRIDMKREESIAEYAELREDAKLVKAIDVEQAEIWNSFLQLIKSRNCAMASTSASYARRGRTVCASSRRRTHPPRMVALCHTRREWRNLPLSINPISRLRYKERRERTRFPDPRYPINLESADAAFHPGLHCTARHPSPPWSEFSQNTMAVGVYRYLHNLEARWAKVLMPPDYAKGDFALRLAYALSLNFEDVGVPGFLKLVNVPFPHDPDPPKKATVTVTGLRLHRAAMQRGVTVLWAVAPIHVHTVYILVGIGGGKVYGRYRILVSGR